MGTGFDWQADAPGFPCRNRSETALLHAVCENWLHAKLGPRDGGALRMVIRWTDAMSVGVPRLDRDHQTLVALINRIGEADDGMMARNRVIPEVLVTLVAYTTFHFQREERVMRAVEYPELDVHREEHWALSREVHLLQRRYSDDRTSLSREDILTFLGDWLNHHILLQDMAYKPFAEGRADAEAAALSFGDFDLNTLLHPAENPDFRPATG